MANICGDMCQSSKKIHSSVFLQSADRNLRGYLWNFKFWGEEGEEKKKKDGVVIKKGNKSFSLKLKVYMREYGS